MKLLQFRQKVYNLNNMTNKNTIIAISLIVALFIGWYFFYPMIRNQNLNNVNNEVPRGDQAKINIEEVCNGALAYMTFPDAASAEVFLTECKAGNRPEVIDQYRASLNLDSDVQI